MAKAVKLMLDGKHIGYRFTDGAHTYDVELDVVLKLGISVEGITKHVKLEKHGKLLASTSERSSGMYAEDISNNPDFIGKLFRMVGRDDVPTNSVTKKPNILVSATPQ